MKLLLAGTSLHSAYGGPAYSVSRLAVALAASGIDVGVWASDQSVGTAPLLTGGPAVRRLTGTAAEALDQFGHADLLHDNGLWLSHNHRFAELAARRRIPRIVSTRGMLEPWAFEHKRLKKKIAWWVYQRRDLVRAHGHHATSEAEAGNLRRLGLGVPVRVIPNGVDLPTLHRGAPRMQGVPAGARQRVALFLGRIAPVKGLPMLVDAWARLQPAGWHLNIAGPDEAGHRAQVERAVAAAGLQQAVSFLGPLEGEAKRSALFGADLFVLPTHSESFGMAIAEALAHGVPVLTTTAAPWPMLSTRSCGWSVAPTVEDIAEGLRQATRLDSEALESMGSNGRAFVSGAFGWDAVAKQFLSLYKQLIS